MFSENCCGSQVRKHGKRVVVMKPVKGGFLSDPPAPKALARMREMHPDRTPAEWVLRFAASQDGVLVVLSGMSDFAQVDENARQMADFTPLTGEEQALPGDAVREIQKAGPLHTADYSVYQDAGGRNSLCPVLWGPTTSFRKREGGRSRAPWVPSAATSSCRCRGSATSRSLRFTTPRPGGARDGSRSARPRTAGARVLGAGAGDVLQQVDGGGIREGDDVRPTRRRMRPHQG